jgi:hypothetical protein
LPIGISHESFKDHAHVVERICHAEAFAAITPPTNTNSGLSLSARDPEFGFQRPRADQAMIELELRKRKDIRSAVSQYVDQTVSTGRRQDTAEFCTMIFVDDVDDAKDMLVDRVRNIIESLHDGNAIAYGISRKSFENYNRIGASAKPPAP